MASIWEKAISILVVNLSSGHGYLIIAVQKTIIHTTNEKIGYLDWKMIIASKHIML